MTRSSTRFLPTARFLFQTGMAVAVLLLFANVASAEEGGGEQAQGGKNMSW